MRIPFRHRLVLNGTTAGYDHSDVAAFTTMRVVGASGAVAVRKRVG